MEYAIPTPRVLILAFLAVAAPWTTAAQTVVGRLTDRSTGQPLEAAFLVLLDEAGAQQSATLTNRDGRYILRAPGPGRYTLRAELIGYASQESEPLELAPDEVLIHNMAVSVQAIELRSIEVTGQQRCTVHPGAGLRTAELWEEARKALRLAAWTEEEGAVRLRAVDFERRMDAEARRVLSERLGGRSGYFAGGPYQSVPAQELSEQGYAREEADGSWSYFAPDAQVLLSDPFLDGHCFELTRQDSLPGLIGLAFRPVRRRAQTDIRGVLWMDRASAELRRLEFTYVNLPYPVESPLLGGRVDFERLESGPWIVRSWRIRMPEVEMGRQRFGTLRAGSDTYRVVAIRETGGEVQEVESSVGADELSGGAAGEVGSVVGRVYAPEGVLLGGAQVSVVGTVRNVRTATDGRFELHGLLPGVYELRVTPVDWELPWVPPVSAELEVVPGDSVHVEVPIPTAADLAPILCEETASDSLPAMVLGRVTEATTGTPLSGQWVVLAWGAVELVTTGNAVGARVPWRAINAQTDDDGWYLACGLPVDRRIRVRVVPAYDSSPDVTAGRLWQAELGMPPDAREVQVGYREPFARVDLEVDPGRVAGIPDPGRVPDVKAPGIDEPSRPPPGDSTVIPLDPLVVEGRRGSPVAGNLERSARPAHTLAGERMATLERAGVSFPTAVRELGAGLRTRTIQVDGHPQTCVESARSGPVFGGGGCRMVAIVVDGMDTGMDGAEAARYLRNLRVSDLESLQYLAPLDAGLLYGPRAGERGALVLWTRGRGPLTSKARGGGRER